MNKFNSFIIAILSTFLVLPSAYIATSQPIPNQPNFILANNTLSSEQIRQLAQAVTVKVLSNNKGGSGVLISKQGQTYTILTNAHVISNKGTYRIQTQDGKTYTATVINQGNSLKGNDLAVLQFKSQEKYQIIPLTGNSNLAENQEVFAAGFPDDSKELVITNGKISLLSTQPLTGGYQIGYTNEIRQGMSGGALLNQSGQLIGINGLLNNAILSEAYSYQDGTKPNAEKLQQLRQLSFAVPIQTLAKVAPNLAIIPPEWRNQQQATKPVGNTFVDKVDNIAQQITVRIDFKDKKDNKEDNGSGVIIAKEGNTYYVVTVGHVVENKYQHQIITPDGKQYTVQPENIFKPKGIEAALLKFTSSQTYSVATISKYNLSSAEVFSKYNGSSLGDIETAWVFISGFPGADNGKRKLAPGYLAFGERLVFNAESNPLLQAFVEGGYRLAYSNLSLPGMSGGPVLDVNGQVIGINAGIERREIRQTEIGLGYGVPSSSILSLATQAGLNNKSLTVVSTKSPSIKDSEIALLENNPLFVIKKPSADASENDWLQYANQIWRIRRVPETISVLQEIIKRKPDFYQAYFVLGAALGSESKDPEKALAALDKATMLKPDFYEAWGEKSILLSDLKKYPLALAAIDKAIEDNDDVLSLYLRRSLILVSLKRYPEALTTIDKAIQIQPHYFSYFIRAIIGFTSQDYQGVVTDINQVIKLQPDFALAYAYRGLDRIFLKDTQGAMADINQAIKLAPDNPLIYLVRGAIRRQLKDYQESLTDYTKAIAINPQLNDAYIGRGLIYTEQKKWDLALADFTKAIAIDPEYADAYVGRGVLYAGQKKGDLALADFTKAITINPEYAGAYVVRGLIYTAQKKWDLALADYTKAIVVNPQLADAYNKRGDLYTQQKKWDLALADYTKAIAVNPQLADAYYNRGYLYTQQKKWDLALADYTKAIAINPEYTYAYNDRGDLYYNQKKWDLALADYNQAIKLQPDNANVYFWRGNVYVQLKNYQTALADYNQGIKLQPDNANAYFSRGDIYKNQLKNYQAALADYSQGIKLQPENAQAYVARGDVYVQLKDYQAALRNYTQGIKLQPDNANAYFSRGVIYQKQGNDRAALAEYNQAIAKDGKSAPAIINIGYIKYEKGDVEGAIQQWEKAVQINGSLAEPQMAIAVALYAKGEQEKALKMAQAALRIDKSFADVEVLKQNLWGTRLVAEAEKLFSHPSIEALRTKQ